MAEFIERENAIKEAVAALHCAAHIDAVDVASALEEIPTADVQEIVRCKDCKHATFYSCKNDACYKSILCDYEIQTDDENFYCAYGERRK